MNKKYQHFHLWAKKLMIDGARKGLVQKFDNGLIERLRHLYFSGMPISVLAVSSELSAGKCYERSTLISLGMDDFNLVRGDVRSLELHYGNDKAEHQWVESAGWVYDTSVCLKIKKELYYKIEKPNIKDVWSKEECLKDEGYQTLLAASKESREDYLPFLIPLLNGIAEDTTDSNLKQEITQFLATINQASVYERYDAKLATAGLKNK